MRIFYFPVLLFFFLNINENKAQFVNIPDTNFVNWLNLHGYSSCMNGNLMDTTCSLIVNATQVNCSYGNIHDLTGIRYFDHLTFLECSNNFLTTFPDLPGGLRNLWCRQNNINYISSLPPSLSTLDCTLNNLSSLPLLPSSLFQLNCGYNLLNNLPTLPASLRVLDCQSNNLTVLPVLPDLIKLSCGSNQLYNLPSLPISLTTLKCSSNHLTSLPPIINVGQLEISGNPITSLPALPASLVILEVWGTPMTILPLLPPFLRYLSCGPLFNSLTNLPDTLSWLYIADNPSLKCLPRVNFINDFRWWNTGIVCLPNVITIGSAMPSVSNIPICNLFNQNNCDFYWNINGNIFNDTNSNCIKNITEPVYRNIKLKLFNGTNLIQQTYSDQIGRYSFDVDIGTYLYKPDSMSTYIVNCPNNSYRVSHITALDSLDNNMDFSLTCRPGFDLGVLSIIRVAGNFRPSSYTTLKITAGDLSKRHELTCASGIGGTVQVVMHGPVTFISASPGALTPLITGDTLTYSISDFGIVDIFSAFQIYLQTDTTALIGQQVCFDVTVSTISGDNDITNNSYSHCFTIQNSFDPNEKEAYPLTISSRDGDWVTYTIYFQNTGNAPAHNIYILDTLESLLSAETFQLLNFSFQPLVQIIGHVIRLNFPNINLIDSVTDEPNSHGYIQFRIRSLSNLVDSSSIQNTASIYFDLNAPIQTNTVSTLASCQLNISPNVQQTNNTLSILNAGAYQWYDCDNHSVISGQTNSSFTPISNGNYAGILISSTCIDTTTCFHIVTTGVNQHEDNIITFSPNPAIETISIEVKGKNIIDGQLLLYDISGRLLQKQAFNIKAQLFVENLDPGIYIVEIVEKNNNPIRATIVKK